MYHQAAILAVIIITVRPVPSTDWWLSGTPGWNSSLQVLLHIFVHIYTYMYVCIYKCIFFFTGLAGPVYIFMICIYICTIHIYEYTFVYTYMIYLCISLHMNIYIYMYIYIYTFLNGLMAVWDSWLEFFFTGLCEKYNIHFYIWILIFVCTQYISVYMNMHI
jgi:hypothetical protein